MTSRFRTEDGDAGQFTASIGRPSLLAKTGLANKNISGNCSLGDRDLLVQVKTTITITSSMTADITGIFDTSGGTFGYGIFPYRDAPTLCDSIGEVSFKGLKPNSPVTYTYWVVFSNVITPNNSSGEPEEELSLSLFDVPGFRMGAKVFRFTEVFGSHVFECPSPIYGSDYKVVYAPVPLGSTVNEQNMEACLPLIG